MPDGWFLRRGRLLWKVGILKQIMHNRRLQGKSNGVFDIQQRYADSLNLTHWRQARRIKRYERLWWKLYSRTWSQLALDEARKSLAITAAALVEGTMSAACSFILNASVARRATMLSFCHEYVHSSIIPMATLSAIDSIERLRENQIAFMEAAADALVDLDYCRAAIADKSNHTAFTMELSFEDLLSPAPSLLPGDDIGFGEAVTPLVSSENVCPDDPDSSASIEHEDYLLNKMDIALDASDVENDGPGVDGALLARENEALLLSLLSIVSIEGAEERVLKELKAFGIEGKKAGAEAMEDGSLLGEQGGVDVGLRGVLKRAFAARREHRLRYAAESENASPINHSRGIMFHDDSERSAQPVVTNLSSQAIPIPRITATSLQPLLKSSAPALSLLIHESKIASSPLDVAPFRFRVSNVPLHPDPNASRARPPLHVRVQPPKADLQANRPASAVDSSQSRTSSKPQKNKFGPSFEEREAVRKAQERQMKKLLLYNKADEVMKIVEREERLRAAKAAKKRAKQADNPDAASQFSEDVEPLFERLLSTERQLPESDLIETERVARRTITQVRIKLSAGRAAFVNRPYSKVETMLLENPYATPIVEKYQRRIDQLERERRLAEIQAMATDQSVPANKGKKRKH